MKKEKVEISDGELLVRLNEQFTYRKETGEFLRKRAWGKHKVGDVAGYNNKSYRSLSINSNDYLIHRLVYLVEHGYTPLEVDHINQIRNDNRIENLRGCDNYSQNQGNCSLRSDNTSGYRGVTWNEAAQKWKAQIMVNGITNRLGLFTDILEAAAAYEAAAIKHFGKFYFKAS